MWQWDQQEPFGGTWANENPGGAGIFDMPLRFPGQYFDKETNLHYNYFRDYSPETGRYLESDPIGLAGGLNTYAYVYDNPLSQSDPTGEASQAIGPLLAGIAALRVCSKIAACKKKMQELIKKCKDIRCEVKREVPNHRFDTPIGGKSGWCVHIRITCWTVGSRQRPWYEAQWPVGQCFDTKQPKKPSDRTYPTIIP